MFGLCISIIMISYLKSPSPVWMILFTPIKFSSFLYLMGNGIGGYIYIFIYRWAGEGRKKGEGH